MANFHYTARTSTGKIVSGVQEATTENEAVNILHGKKLLVTKIFKEEGKKKAKADRAVRRGRRRHRKIKPDDLLFFVGQMATLLDAGIPVFRALEITLDQVTSDDLAKILSQIKDDIRAGSTLKDAIARFPLTFPPIWSSLIDAGEASGNLPFVLTQLSSYVESSIKLKKKLVSALVYPAVLIFVAVGAILAFLLKIIPVFAEMFENMNAELPAITQAMIGMSDFVKANFFQGLIVVWGLFYLIRRYFKSSAGRIFLDQHLLKVPTLGDFIRDSILARVAMNLAVLIKSGVNIMKGLEITARASGNAVYETALLTITNQIQQGKSLSSCIKENAHFPHMMGQMLEVGEESGRLPDMMFKVATYYEERVDIFVGRLSVLIEPLILVFVGGIIGVIVIAMFMPIFSITQQF